MEVTPLSESESVVWRSLVLLWRQGFPLLEPTFRRLGLTHLEYGLLAVLAEQSDGELPAGELARVAGVSTSRLAHRLRRLESVGDVARRADPHDARGVLVQITDTGRAKIQQAYAAHLADVRHLVFDQLTDKQTEALAEALHAIVRPLPAGHLFDVTRSR